MMAIRRISRKSEDNLNRRDVLSGIGSIALGSTVVGSANAAERRNGFIVSEFRTPDDPIDAAHLEEIQNKAAVNHRSIQSLDEVVPVGGPVVRGENGKLVSYALKVFPDGTSRFQASLTSNDVTNIEQQYQKTTDFVQKFEKEKYYKSDQTTGGK